MRIMASQITYNAAIFDSLLRETTKKDQLPALLAICKGNPSVTRKGFYIMTSLSELTHCGTFPEIGIECHEVMFHLYSDGCNE